MDLHDFIFAAVVVLVAATLSVIVFNQFRLGSILGLLVAGIVIGPYTPGIQVTDDPNTVLHFAELGVVFLLFLKLEKSEPLRLMNLWGILMWLMMTWM